MVTSSKYDDVITQFHQHLVAGHWGIPRVTASLQRHFVMHRARHFVLQHVRTCASCQLANVEHTKTRGLLQPLTIPTRKWQYVHMDWIVKLPPVVYQCRTYDQVLVFTDRATKMVHLAPTCAKATAIDTATQFILNVVKYHGLPR